MQLNCIELVEEEKIKLKERVQTLQDKGIYPKVCILQVYGDPASDVYTRNKKKLFSELDIDFKHRILKEDINIDELEEIVYKDTKSNYPVFLQLPLPEHLKKYEYQLTNLIDYEKDVDGLGCINLGSLIQGYRNARNMIPCTPKGIMKIFRKFNINLEGKDVVIINRSNLVGKPLALLCLQKNATVTICHSKTKNLFDKINNADIVITAVGISNFINEENCTRLNDENFIVIDVSMNRDENGKLCGDLSKAKDWNCKYTPVPNGVGRTTVLSLAENIIEYFENNR